jgi:DNA primase
MTYDELAEIDVEDIIRQTGINATLKGDYYSCFCPFHNNTKSPAAAIYPDRRYFKCFAGCGGHSLAWVYTRLTGKKLEKGETTLRADRPVQKRPVPIHRELEIKGDFVPLENNLDARMYCLERKIPESFLEHFKVTTAMQTVRLNTTGFFRRLVIPIVEEGRVVSYEGRTYDRDANLEETPKVLYPKKLGGIGNATLFNLDDLDYDEPLIIVEGLIDFAVLWGYGYRNITCVFGVEIDERQKTILQRFSRLINFMDDDEAGETFSENLSNFHKNSVYVTCLPGRDPKYGTKEEIDFAIQNAKSFTEFFSERYGLTVDRPSLSMKI